ncbi:sensor histidine kinase [Streptacidiphilus sp. PAMC 29251]
MRHNTTPPHGLLHVRAIPRSLFVHRAVSTSITPPASASPLVEGWPTGLRLALDNLLDNAALHGKAHGRVQVELQADTAAVQVSVTDDGPGIPEDLREAMKARFARGPHPRSDGSGLGLALVEQQTQLHGGTLHLDQAPTSGLRATLTLPQPPSAGLG